jgi:hypothetical protein
VQPEPHQAPGKEGPEEPQDHALGGSRGGLTTKIHMLFDANGVPLRFLLSGGQASDIVYAQPLLDEAYIPSLRGRLANAADGCWPTRVMTLRLCVATVIAIGCNR